MSDDLTTKVREKYELKAAGYDRFMAPMEKMMMGKWREKLCSQAQGLVLEAGVGTGANLAYYREGVQVVAVDFSPKMLERANLRINQAKVPIELKLADIQDLPFPDNTFDTVITACVFCSVPDAVKGFRELRRVVKPEGNLYFLEHVRSEGKILGPLMDRLNPLSYTLSGVNINRRTEKNIQLAGMKVVLVENLFGDVVKLLTVKPNKNNIE